jgi:hypothetical protein
MMGFAEPVIGPATSGRTRWLNPSYGLRPERGRPEGGAAHKHFSFYPKNGHSLSRVRLPRRAKTGREQMQQTMCANARLLDHLVGEGMHLERNFKAKRLCGLQVEHEIELGWLQNRQVRRLLAFENAARIASSLAE